MYGLFIAPTAALLDWRVDEGPDRSLWLTVVNHPRGGLTTALLLVFARYKSYTCVWVVGMVKVVKGGRYIQIHSK